MKKKRILISKCETIILYSLGLAIAGFGMYLRPEGMSVFQWFTDPLGIVSMCFMLLMIAVSSLYYEVTDEYIRLCHFVFRTPKIMIDSIVSVGIVRPDDEGKEIYVTYLKYIGENNEEKYFFLMPSYKLYDYISENFSLNYEEDNIDRASRNSLNSRMNKKTEKTISLICVVIIVPPSLLLFIKIVLAFVTLVIEKRYWMVFLSLLGLILIYVDLIIVMGLFFRAYEKVSFDDTGVYVKFPLHRLMRFSWDDFQQVCMIYDMTTGNRGFNNTRDILICFVRHGVKKGLISGAWPVKSLTKYKKIFSVQYSENLMNQLEKCCPHNIVDLRGSGAYRH